MEKEGWPGVAETESMWKDDLSQRRIVSGFMKDKTIGDKRLASMPDRVTNAIGTMVRLPSRAAQRDRTLGGPRSDASQPSRQSESLPTRQTGKPTI
eukprot:6183241-Pleurochrysis_carterae.AAC.3